MKKLLALLVVVNLLVVAVLASLVFLAETYPFQPGDQLYAVQTLAERGRLHLIPDDTRQAKFAIELAERRLADLARVRGADQIETVAASFEQTLSESVEHIQAVPEAQQEHLKDRLNAVMVKTGSVVMAFDPGGQDSAVTRLQEKIAAFHSPAAERQDCGRGGLLPGDGCGARNVEQPAGRQTPQNRLYGVPRDRAFCRHGRGMHQLPFNNAG